MKILHTQFHCSKFIIENCLRAVYIKGIRVKKVYTKFPQAMSITTSSRRVKDKHTDRHFSCFIFGVGKTQNMHKYCTYHLYIPYPVPFYVCRSHLISQYLTVLYSGRRAKLWSPKDSGL